MSLIPVALDGDRSLSYTPRFLVQPILIRDSFRDGVVVEVTFE
jgi:hypothetical protein